MDLRRFIQENYNVGLCPFEKSGALTHKHFQMMVKGNFSSLRVFNNNIKVALDGMKIL